ncbi:antimicrobial peptide NK-lysin isoform X1 [Oryzias melastigma]|uniref:antimicrobial peptide NK-lysin isoform X1 n=1 Tax=Oryzias melastigma TaxID=30732 RepID=UPI000CF8182E|nr:antimicrobial peptide NK-lysin isoform X1 [Oryzias melastigma]
MVKSWRQCSAAELLLSHFRPLISAKMETSSVLLLAVLMMSVWTMSETGRVTVIDEDQLEVSAEALPGMCWGCKWMLNKVKASLGNTTNVEKIKSVLLRGCDKIGLLKRQCKNFLSKNLGILIEELTTTDDVRTICVNVKVCRPKELLDLGPIPNEESFMDGSYIP